MTRLFLYDVLAASAVASSRLLVMVSSRRCRTATGVGATTSYERLYGGQRHRCTSPGYKIMLIHSNHTPCGTHPPIGLYSFRLYLHFAPFIRNPLQYSMSSKMP